MKNLSYSTALSYYLGIFCLVFCAFPKLSTIGIIGLLPFMIAGYVRRKVSFRFNWPAALLVLLYLAYAIGVFFTRHPHQAGIYLENKLSFIVFPLLLSVRFREGFSLRPVVIGLISGVVTASLIGLWHAVSCYMSSGVFTCLLTVGISPIHHPSYFVAFHLLAIFAAWQGYRQSWKGFRLWWIVLFTLFSVVIQGLSLSLAGLLFLFIFGIVVALLFLRKRFGKLVFTISLVLIPVVAVLLFLGIPQFRGEVEGAGKYVGAYRADPEKFVRERPYPMTGSEVRLVMWTVSAHEFAAHPWGVGTGNVDEHLSARLFSYGQEELAKKDDHGAILYNPHNQYLQTSLETGMLGLLILLLIIGISIRFAWKHKNWLLLLLASNLAFNCLFESMLQRQSGIIFYSFWICLLAAYSLSNARNPSSEP